MEENKQQGNKKTEIIDMYIDIYNNFKELNSIKRLIKDHIVFEDDKLSFESSYSFTEDLLKLIKYIDPEFYESLKETV